MVHQHRQTALGMAWVFLPPLANALLWIFLHRQKVLAFEAPRGVPYPLFVLTGMVIWQSFVDALQMPLMVVRQNRAMVTKLHFPREALLMVGWLEVGWNGLARCLVLFLLAAWYGVPWSGSAWLFPVGWLGLVVLGTAIGLWILPLGTLYQDVEKLLVLGLPLWMIVTPIIYPVSELGADHWLVALNPAAGLVVMARDGLVAGEGSLAGWAVLYGGAAIPLLLGGLLLYRLSLPVLIERMPS